MKQLNCKLIVSDFDGTLANSGNEVDGQNVSAINRYVKDGGIFAVCTGRILPSILPRVREIGLKGLVAACQGSVIADSESGEIIRAVTFSSAEAAEICASLEEMGVNIQAYFLRGFFSNLPEDEKHLNMYESIIGVKALHADVSLSEVIKRGEYAFNKFAVMCRKEEQAELYAAIRGRLGGKFDVTCSANVLIEISPYGETKGSALKFLAEHYSVPIGKTCAVGDNLNDLSMLEAAGYGVAVANCSPLLKERVKYITASNDEGAVARVIEDFGYKR